MKDHPVLTNSKPYFKEIKPKTNEVSKKKKIKIIFTT